MWEWQKNDQNRAIAYYILYVMICNINYKGILIKIAACAYQFNFSIHYLRY